MLFIRHFHPSSSFVIYPSYTRAQYIPSLSSIQVDPEITLAGCWIARSVGRHNTACSHHNTACGHQNMALGHHNTEQDPLS